MILLGDSKGYELIDLYKKRSKFSILQRDAFDTWIVSHFDLVKQNLLKIDMMCMRNLEGNILFGNDNKPICI